MKMLVTITVIFGLAAAPVASQEISLDVYLDELQRYHPFFIKERMAKVIEQEQLHSLEGDEDWVVTASPSYAHNERSQSSSIAAEETDLLSLNAGVERLFWSNGSRVGVTYDYFHLSQRFSQPVGAFDEHGHGVTLSYSLPLLKNRGGILNRLNRDLQAYNVDLAEVVATENQESFLEQRAFAFLDWVLLSEQLRIANNRLALAEQELARTEKKRRSRLVAEVDVLRAQDAVISAQQQRQAIDARLQALKAELATDSGDASLYHAEPIFDLYAFQTAPSIEITLAELQQQSRLLKVIDVQLAQIDQQQQGLDHQLKPELDLVLSGGLRSEDGRFVDSAEFDKPQYSFGLNFRFPLGQRSAKADLSRSRLQRQQLTHERASVALKLEAELRNVLVQLNKLEDVMRLNQEQIIVAQQKTAAELHRYNLGRSELTFVIQSRDGEQNARLIYAENAVNYQKLWLRYRSLTDTLWTSAATPIELQ